MKPLFEIALCTHRGSAREQQDAVLVGNRVIQSAHTSWLDEISANELLIGIADGVATSPSAALASRRYLAALTKVRADGTNAPMTAGHVRAAHQLFCDELTRTRSSYGVAPE